MPHSSVLRVGFLTHGSTPLSFLPGFWEGWAFDCRPRSSHEEVTMFTGCGTALVTPFHRDLSLDEPTLRRLVRRQIEAGIHFLVPCGTTGESPTLTHAEHLRVVGNLPGRSARKNSGPGRRRRLQHRRSDRPGARTRTHGRARHPLGHAVLQQAHRRRSLPALQSDRRIHAPSRDRLQRARPHQRQRSSRIPWCASRKSITSSE